MYHLMGNTEQIIILIIIIIDLTITTEKLKDLFAIWDRDRVDSIGRNLCLPEFKIKQIQRNYHNPMERKEAYLDLYAYDHPCPSWKDIAEILRLFNLLQQFHLVNETYIKGMFDSKSLIITVTKCAWCIIFSSHMHLMYTGNCLKTRVLRAHTPRAPCLSALVGLMLLTSFTYK